MIEDREVRDSLPDHFATPDEAAEFWDTHSSAEYEEYFQEVHFEVDLRGRTQEVRVEDRLMREVRKIARQRGVRPETLVNLWLQEKVAATG